MNRTGPARAIGMLDIPFWVTLGVRYYSQRHPGRLRDLAAQGEEGKQRFVIEATAEIRNLGASLLAEWLGRAALLGLINGELRNPVVQALLAGKEPRHEDLERLLGRVVATLKQGTDEAGQVARAHPTWLSAAIYGTVRRVIADAGRSTGRGVSPGVQL